MFSPIMDMPDYKYFAGVPMPAGDVLVRLSTTAQSQNDSPR
jgi:hypothetical protein